MSDPVVHHEQAPMSDPWTCPHCGTHFPVPSLTVDHIRTEHTQEQP